MTVFLPQRKKEKRVSLIVRSNLHQIWKRIAIFVKRLTLETLHSLQCISACCCLFRLSPQPPHLGSCYSDICGSILLSCLSKLEFSSLPSWYRNRVKLVAFKPQLKAEPISRDWLVRALHVLHESLYALDRGVQNSRGFDFPLTSHRGTTFSP